MREDLEQNLIDCDAMSLWQATGTGEGCALPRAATNVPNTAGGAVSAVELPTAA